MIRRGMERRRPGRRRQHKTSMLNVLSHQVDTNLSLNLHMDARPTFRLTPLTRLRHVLWTRAAALGRVQMHLRRLSRIQRSRGCRQLRLQAKHSGRNEGPGMQ
jgi:hypothetical protein